MIVHSIPACHRAVIAFVKSDADKAGQTPGPVSIQSTCAGVVMQINTTRNIDLAKRLCTQELKHGCCCFAE